MGKRIFISYKYWDKQVYQDQSLEKIEREYFLEVTPRSYVNKLQKKLSTSDHLNMGEKDDEDISSFKEETISSKLRDKIYHSTITIVLISPGMKDANQSDDNQWIPWEIAYSLKEHTRDGRTSKTNALLAIVLPDIKNSYNYFLEKRTCCITGCTFYNHIWGFGIISRNLFNQKNSRTETCARGDTTFYGNCNYIVSAKWSDFIENIDLYIDQAIENNKNIAEYEICKTV